MNLFRKLFGKSAEAETEAQPKQDTEKQAQGNSCVPILKVGHFSEQTISTPDGQVLNLPASSLPVSQKIGATELSVVIGVDKGAHYEWLQNKELRGTAEESIREALKNLVTGDELGIGQVEELGLENCKIGVLQSSKGLASSYILLDSIWEKIFAFCNSTDVTFIVPNQDRLLFCSSTDKDFFSAELFLHAMTEYLPQAEPKPLSKKIFVKRKGEVIIQKN